MKDGPIQGLHAADGAAQHQAQLADSQRVQQLRLGPHIVADGDQRKVRPIGFAGLRIHRARPRGAITGAEHVDADHEVVFQRKNRARAQRSQATRSRPGPNRRAHDRPARRCPALHSGGRRPHNAAWDWPACGHTPATGARRAQSRLRRWDPEPSRWPSAAGAAPVPMRASLISLLIVQHDPRLRPVTACAAVGSFDGTGRGRR